MSEAKQHTIDQQIEEKTQALEKAQILVADEQDLNQLSPDQLDNLIAECQRLASELDLAQLKTELINDKNSTLLGRAVLLEAQVSSSNLIHNLNNLQNRAEALRNLSEKRDQLPALKEELAGLLTELTSKVGGTAELPDETDLENRRENIVLLQELSAAMNDVEGKMIVSSLLMLLAVMSRLRLQRAETDALKGAVSAGGVGTISEPQADFLPGDTFLIGVKEKERNGWYVVEEPVERKRPFYPARRRVGAEFKKSGKIRELKKMKEEGESIRSMYTAVLKDAMGFRVLTGAPSLYKRLHLLYVTNNGKFEKLKPRVQYELAAIGYLLMKLKNSSSQDTEYRVREEIDFELDDEAQTKLNTIAADLIAGSITTRSESTYRKIVHSNESVRQFLDELLEDTYLEKTLLERRKKTTSFATSATGEAINDSGNQQSEAVSHSETLEQLKQKLVGLIKTYDKNFDPHEKHESEDANAGKRLVEQKRVNQVFDTASETTDLDEAQVLAYCRQVLQKAAAGKTENISTLLAWFGGNK